MPPPRLPRHLWPCRPPWSALQVRFASDTPSNGPATAGGNNETGGDSGANDTRSASHVSQAQRMRTRLGGGPVSPSPSRPLVRRVDQNGTEQLRIRRVDQNGVERPQKKVEGSQKKVEGPPIRRLEVKKYAVPPTSRYQNAFERHVEKVKEARQEHSEAAQQPDSSAESTEKLRKKLSMLEEQLAQLQQKLKDEAQATEQPASTKARITSPPNTTMPLERSSKSESVTIESPRTKSPNTESPSTMSPSEEPLDSELHSTQQPMLAKENGEAARTTEAPETTEAATTRKYQKNTVGKKTRSSSVESISHLRTPRPAPAPASAPADPAPASLQVSNKSLLAELFPGASVAPQPKIADRPSPPKLNLPAPDAAVPIRMTPVDTRTDREKSMDAFRARGEKTTVLQLSHCSTALTEADFRRLIPRGLHIDTWSSHGEFYKIVPGRDPISLARLPFYYLFFRSPESALAYQKNASRVSKLCALHESSSIHSPVPPPRGFLEDGEDINAITSAFVLHPQGHKLDLRTVMQPYSTALRALIDSGGYAPIVPNTDDKGKKIHRVLLHIDGYEPSHWDLWQILARHAHARGILWPFRNEHSAALRRLRDCINLKTSSKLQAVSSTNPRAADSAHLDYDDPQISSFLGTSSSEPDDDDGQSGRQMSQLVMNRVYNRWIVELDDEDAARRFAGLWHRTVLPHAKGADGAWKEVEEERWVEAEYLW
ncbi:hypothetical protein E8E13_003328 [Curvularia kusanoi]|uniref:Uncharacterized protein n=1 Tax=Curvularia kusanoi TaxID=90978 RepID=A0A9P4TLD0_CURKU|nr:hypothetical protein E8E13_003328 [Curvularia kusanoi]